MPVGAAAAAALFVGKQVGTATVSFWDNKAFTYLIERYKAEGLEDVGDRVQKSMEKVQAVLDGVNPEQIKERSAALDAWIWQLRDAAEQAEDAIDELEYHKLREKGKDRKVTDWGSSFAKVRHGALRSVKQFRSTRHGTLKRLRKAMDSLDKVATDFGPILDVAKHVKDVTSCSLAQENWRNHRDTGSTLTEPYFVGREMEKERILQRLAKTASDDESSEIVRSTSTNGVPVLSVVGDAGMGKTTLAQCICEQEDMMRQFKVIWVCVSTRFDANLVTGKILESLTGARPGADGLDALQRILKLQLLSGKFFLVLDDVWEDKEKSVWEKVFAPLRKGGSGSKILVTTRMRSVADMAASAMGVKREYLELKGLQGPDNDKLFSHHVFSGLNPQHYEELKPIGEQIAEQLRGCPPLLTKVVSGHLQCNMSLEYWDSFLQEDLEQFIGSEHGTMEAIRFSYDNLPTELQICFRYCSIFPQGYKFKKKDLVLMWMGSGLILQSGSERRLEDVGDKILAQLTSQSFFEMKFKVVGYSQRREEYYIMHDLMHELAKNVSSGECATIVDPSMLEKEKGTVRHLRISSIHKFSTEEVKQITRFKNLRTIIIDGSGFISMDLLSMVEHVIQKFKSLRLLRSNLENTYHLPKLANLKHLRYIHVHNISSKGICGLIKLYHLLLVECLTDWGEEPRQARYLGNIDHLRYVNFGPFRNGDFPIGRLTSLQELHNYRVLGSKGNKISAIKNLKDLLELEVLGLENVSSLEEADNAKLNEKTYLNSLSLAWSARANVDRIKDELILDRLEPHDKVRNLRISGYGGTRVPVWIENLGVKNLVSLELARCLYWENLPSFGLLQSLRKLWLECLPNLQHIGKPFQLSNTRCMDSYLPPNLDTLIVRGCNLLTQLPILPPSLIHLEICKVGLTEFPIIGKLHSENMDTKQSNLQFVSIEECEWLTSLEESLLLQTLHIEAIRVLRISNCKKLESAPLLFKQMNKLRELDISNCPKLRISSEVGEKTLPPSLEKLTVKQCGDLEIHLIDSLQGLTNLSELVLDNCQGLVSLPSAEVCKSLQSLKFLEILCCKNLTSLGGLGSLGSLIALKIRTCSKLGEVGLLTSQASGAADEADNENDEETPASSLQIDYLEVDCPSVLNMEPLKSLCGTKGLVVVGGVQMESLPELWLLQNYKGLQSLRVQGASSLQSLPQRMRELSTLSYLLISGAEKLQSLPDLPPSLQTVYVMGCCPELEAQIRVKGSLEWSKISNIPMVHIAAVKIVQSNRPLIFHAGYYYMFGKECSEETFYGRCNQ